MPTARKVAEAFSLPTGLRPWTVEGQTRQLRAAGLVPMGEKGGSKLVGHYEAPHLANMVMSFHRFLPGNAAKTVNLVRPLPYQYGIIASGAVHFPFWEWGDWLAPRADVGQALEHMISELANLIDARHRGDLSEAEYSSRLIQLVPYEIRISLAPLVVEMGWYGPNNYREGPNTRTDKYFGSPKNDESGHAYDVSSITFIRRGVIVAAADLLRKNPSWQPVPPFLPPAPANANAGQNDESAEHLCHKVPAPSKNQPRANEAGLSDHPRANGSGGLNGLPEDICEKVTA